MHIPTLFVSRGAANCYVHSSPRHTHTLKTPMQQLRNSYLGSDNDGGTLCDGASEGGRGGGREGGRERGREGRGLIR